MKLKVAYKLIKYWHVKCNIFEYLFIWFVQYWYCGFQPTWIQVHAKIMVFIILVLIIWYCRLKNDIVLENLHWPKLLWYVKFIVDHDNSMKRCTIDNMWVRGVLNCNVFVTLFTHFIPQNLAFITSTSPCTCEQNYTSLKRRKVLDGDLALMCACAHTHTHDFLSSWEGLKFSLYDLQMTHTFYQYSSHLSNWDFKFYERRVNPWCLLEGYNFDIKKCFST